jgi:Tfp pilus assembly protein PilW
MSRRSIRNCRGVCLAEVMIALAAGAVVLSATLESLNHFDRRLSKQQTAAAQAQDLRIGLKVLEDELRIIDAGASPTAAPLSVAGRQEIEFGANLGGLVTTLTDAVSSVQQEIPVLNGTDWPKGKGVLVCDREHCAEGRLARDGRKALLNVVAPLGRDFEAGSHVRVVNRVRYSVKTDRNGMACLMRDVDGGVNALIRDLARLEFNYFDGDGALTADPSRVIRVRINAAMGEDRAVTVKDVGIHRR